MKKIEKNVLSVAQKRIILCIVQHAKHIFAMVVDMYLKMGKKVNKKIYVILWCIIVILVFIGVYYYVPFSTMYDSRFERVYLDSRWGDTWLKLVGFWDDVDIWGDSIGGSLYEIHPLWNIFIFIILLIWVLGLLISIYKGD